MERQQQLGDSLHAPPSVTYIPLDIIEEILCRLPVKLLLQFRCVCKSWSSLISDDPQFAKKHLRMSTKRHHLITSTWIPPKEFTITSYPLNSLQIDSIFTTNATQLDYSHVYPYYSVRLIASCDGLLCFTINQRLALVWNPSIRKNKTLPSLEIPQHCKTTYAFGYDPFIDNYKVVVVFYYTRLSNACKTQVKAITLGTDSWRKIEDFPSTMTPCGQPGVFVSGTVNWLASYNWNCFRSSRVIVSLHLGKECYQEISLPDYGSFVELTLDVMRDCLCIFSHSHPFINVWLMKEYGNKESWIKLIRLPYFGGLGYVFTKIVHISEDNHRVLLLFKEHLEHKWIVYNSKNNTIKNLKIQELSWVDLRVYFESLLSP